MGRGVIGALVVFAVAVGGTTTPAQAKDRKSAAGRNHEAVAEMIAAREARANSGGQEAFAASASRARLASTGVEFSSAKPNGKPIAPLADEEPVSSNPFRFNLGRVAVQPTFVGGVKGAQFSIGF